MPLAPGDTVAGYTVVRELGTGGMGAVYLVRHPRLPRLDALKLLRRELNDDPGYTQRFLQEADVVARLAHRNIVSVLDRGEDDGQLWLTMQYVEGTDAETALAAAGGRFPPERAVHIVAEVASALDAAHRQHLVHRDVKPANILLRAGDDGEREQVFLTDFGIAKPLDGAQGLTRTGMVLATFDYASPEQIESRTLDGRSDQYSLGCVLFRLLTGRVPYPGQSLVAAVHGHLAMPPPRPSDVVPALPTALDDVVARAMAKRPEDRYSSCRALAAAAAAALAPRPAPVLVRPTEPETVVEMAGPPLPPPPVTDRRVTGPSSTPPRSPTPAYVDPPAQAAAIPSPSQPARPAFQPPAPQTPAAPAPGRGPGRWIWLAVVVALLVAGGATWWFVGRDSGPSGGGSGSSAAATSASAAQAAFDALPRGAPLPANTLVEPRSVDGEVDLYLVDAATGSTTLQLTKAPGDDVGPLISPDRRSVVYQHDTGGGTELRVVASDGSGDSPLFGSDLGCPNVGRPAWDQADPTRLALTCTAGDGSTLRVVTLDGAVVRELNPGIAVVDDLSSSPDGTRLVYWGAADGSTGGGSLFVLPTDGSAGPQQLTNSSGDADPVWSPDGQHIAFRRATAQGQSHILTIGADGSGETQLTSGTGTDQDPTWSPDGAMIAYKSNRPGDAAAQGDHIWVMQSNGSGQRQLDDRGGSATNAPAWGNR